MQIIPKQFQPLKLFSFSISCLQILIRSLIFWIILLSSCYLFLFAYAGLVFWVFMAGIVGLLCWLRIYVSFLFNFSALLILLSNYFSFIILFITLLSPIFIIQSTPQQITITQPNLKIIIMKKQKSVLITVGTTQFENLIKTTDTDNFVNMLQKNGYTKVIYQIGKGEYVPTHGENFRLSPQISQYYAAADLIITHGGAGTLLQNLLYQKLIIAVANQQLLGNHQTELIDKLATEGYIIGFSSIKQLQKGQDKIQKFITQGNRKIYKRPKNCLLNQIVFGKAKQN